METAICLDSDVIINLLGKKPQAKAALEEHKAAYCTTALTSFEVLFGRDGSPTVESLLERLPSMPFDEHSARVAADIQRTLSSRGNILDFVDVAIGSICIVKKTPLLTLNKKHFERLTEFGLVLV